MPRRKPFTIDYGKTKAFAIEYAQTKARAISLIFSLVFTTLSFHGVDANFFIVFLEGGKILSGLAELAFFHSLANVPNDKDGKWGKRSSW